jgi:hypothetical protein
MEQLRAIEVPETVDLVYVLATAVPRLSLQDEYVVYMISKECTGVVIDSLQLTLLTLTCQE